MKIHMSFVAKSRIGVGAPSVHILSVRCIGWKWTIACATELQSLLTKFSEVISNKEQTSRMSELKKSTKVFGQFFFWSFLINDWESFSTMTLLNPWVAAIFNANRQAIVSSISPPEMSYTARDTTTSAQWRRS